MVCLMCGRTTGRYGFGDKRSHAPDCAFMRKRIGQLHEVPVTEEGT
jgi:hypothetical protein